MLPLTLLRTAQGHPILVEIKSGETYNGVLVNVDHWMNLNMTKVTCTARDGDKFWKISSIYIKGSTIKYMNIPEEVLEMTPDELPEETRDNKKSIRGGRQGGHRGGPQKEKPSSSHGDHQKSDRVRGGARGHSDARGGSSRGGSQQHRGGAGRGGSSHQYKPKNPTSK